MWTINKKNRVTMLCCIIVTIGVLSGCSGSDRQAVSGTVTLDGQMITNGAISFRPTAGTNAPSAGGAIQDGHFSIAKSEGLLPGQYTVAIQAFWKTGRVINDPQMGKVDEILPARFREEGILKATVSADSKNNFEYSLTRIQ